MEQCIYSVFRVSKTSMSIMALDCIQGLDPNPEVVAHMTQREKAYQPRDYT